MPDLQADHVTAWLEQAMPPPLATEWPPPVRAIEAQDDFPVRLAAFGQRLDLLGPAGDPGLSVLLQDTDAQDRLRSLLAQLGAARLLRILHWLQENESNAGSPPYAPLLAGHSPDAIALRASLGALTRTLTLQRIFSRERLAALQAACADAAKEVV